MGTGTVQRDVLFVNGCQLASIAAPLETLMLKTITSVAEVKKLPLDYLVIDMDCCNHTKLPDVCGSGNNELELPFR